MDQLVEPIADVPMRRVPATNAPGLLPADDVVQRKWLGRSILILCWLAGIYALASLWAGRGVWRIAVDTISINDLLSTIALVALALIIRWVRWHYYINRLQWKVPVRYSFAAFIASIAMTATPGKAGELIKGALLREKYGISLSQAAGVLLIERLGDVLAVTVLAIGGIAHFTDLKIYVLAGASIILLALMLFSKPALMRMILLRISVIPKWLGTAGRLIRMLEAIEVLLRPSPMAIGFLLGLVAWSAEAVAFYFLLYRLGIQPPLLMAFSIYGLSTLAGAMSMLPGGVGGFEVVMTFLLTQIAVSTSLAAVTVVLFRLCTLWLFSAVGAIFLVLWIAFFSKIALQGTLRRIS